MVKIKNYLIYRIIIGNLSLKIINYGLVVFIVLINGYLLIAPLSPRINFEVKQKLYKPILLNLSSPNIDRTTNHIVIPSIRLDEPILDGTNPSLVHQGVWRLPFTSSPNRGSNTVLVGHRFTYAGAAVFYNLDKIATNDDIFLVYNRKIYHYRIYEYKIVPPSDIQVEEPTPESILTLYTCTPLWTAKDRLVYKANLVEIIL